MAHLQALGLTDLEGLPDPVGIATEGALWGSVTAHGFLCEAVMVSAAAGQFDVGHHALCWVHAERLVDKLDAFTEERCRIQRVVRGLIWWFYCDLLAFKRAPTARRRAEMRARFDRVFTRETGIVRLDRLLKRLHANKRTCRKLGVSFWHDPGDRLAVPDSEDAVDDLPHRPQPRSSERTGCGQQRSDDIRFRIG